MTVREALRRSFVAGLILVSPLVITAYILIILVNWSLQFINPIVRRAQLAQFTGNIEVVAQLLAVVIIISLVILLGYLAQQTVGRHVFGRIGRVVNIIPLVNSIYFGFRQVANSLVERNTSYESVAVVEYPREGVYSIGLITGQGPRAIEDVIGQDVYSVFLPNSPNPTGGRLALLPEDQVDTVDMSVRRGMRLIVTGGIGGDEGSSLRRELESVSR